MRTVFQSRAANRVLAAFAALLFCASAHAATTYNLGADTPIPLPDIFDIDTADSPVYITNVPDLGGTTSPASEDIDTLRVGQYTELHMGYDRLGVAEDDISINVAGDMIVSGKVMLGKGSTNNQHNLPNSATNKAIDIAVGNRLQIDSGGHVVLRGTGGGSGEEKFASITADNVLLDGGSLTLQDYSSLVTTDASVGGEHSIVIRNGGALTLNSGIPDDPSTPDGRGITANKGILVDNGGTLAAGNIGGVIVGAAGAGQRLNVAAGGMLDAGRGDILVQGFDSISIAGTYRAGLNSHLIAESGTVSFADGGSMALSRDLQRAINSGFIAPADAVLIKSVGEISDRPDKLYSAMGFYTLGDRVDVDGVHYVDVSSVENEVRGTGVESDRERFRGNLELLWTPGRMNRDQSDNIYNLTAVADPRIVAYGASGQLNQAVLEAIVDGKGQAVPGHGVVDQGVFEMYNGAAQWGVNNAGYNIAGEFMAGLDRRVERIGAEMDRLGEGWGGDVVYQTETGYPSLCASGVDGFDRRFWIGGFGRNEEADLDYGITGYKYRPRGFMAGYDKIIGSFSLGAAAAYGKGKYEDKAAMHSDSEITSYSAGVYGTYHANSGLYATAHAAISHLDNDLKDTRGGMRREADHTGYSWSVGARAGYDKLLSDRMTLSPSIGVSRVQAVGRAHDEYLDGVGVLRVGEVTRNSTLVPVDVTLGYDLLRSPTSILRVTGNLGYAYDFEDGGLDGSFSYDGLAGATSMDVAKRESGKHRFNAGAGLIFTGSRIDIGARYDYIKREKETTHQAKGSIGVKF